jgi:hypothetical membrane protein
MSSKWPISPRIAGFCGIIAPITAFCFIGLAVLLSPWFSWTENWLSDLGGFSGGISSVIFNMGLIIAGFLGVIFTLGIRHTGILKNPSGNFGIFSLLITTVALIGIGVFPETTGTPHSVFSMLFFIGIGVSLFLIGVALFKLNEKKLGWFVFILLVFGMISIPLFLTPKPIGSNAIAEMIPIISASVFTIVFGHYLLKHGYHNKHYEAGAHKEKEG